VLLHRRFWTFALHLVGDACVFGGIIPEMCGLSVSLCPTLLLATQFVIEMGFGTPHHNGVELGFHTGEEWEPEGKQWREARVEVVDGLRHHLLMSVASCSSVSLRWESNILK
jgi:hypothetical protein